MRNALKIEERKSKIEATKNLYFLAIYQKRKSLKYNFLHFFFSGISHYLYATKEKMVNGVAYKIYMFSEGDEKFKNLKNLRKLGKILKYLKIRVINFHEDFQRGKGKLMLKGKLGKN